MLTHLSSSVYRKSTIVCRTCTHSIKGYLLLYEIASTSTSILELQHLSSETVCEKLFEIDTIFGENRTGGSEIHHPHNGTSVLPRLSVAG